MVLLDTCTLLWLASDQRMLSPRARLELESNGGALFVSAITAFEIALKHRKGKLTLPLAPARWIEAALDFHGVAELPMTWRIAARAAELPLARGDPCDRIIVATAEEAGLLLLSPDEHLRGVKGVQVAW